MNKDYGPLILLMIVFCIIFVALLVGIGVGMSHYIIDLLNASLPILGL